MAQQSLPKIKKPSTTRYEMLLGVDFRADQTEVERRRSPDMVNMISDIGGNPVKRYGYRKVGSSYKALVTANSETYGVRVSALGIIVVPVTIGTQGTITEDTAKAITIPYTLAMGSVVDVFGYQRYVFVMCQNGCGKIDVTKYATPNDAYEVTGVGAGMMSVGDVGSTAPVCESIVPISTIGLKPDASDGTTYYGKNLMSIYQQFYYQGDGTSTEFKIPLYSKMGAWAKVEVMDTNGNWITKTLTDDYTLGTASTLKGQSLDGTTMQDFSVVDAKVTFVSAPASPSTTLAGEDNVRITVAPFNMADEVTIDGVAGTKGYYNETFKKILSSTAHFLYENRLFLGVVEKSYYSEVNNPFNIPDNYWFSVDNAIVTYTRLSNYLVIITQDTGKNTVFLAQSVDATSTTGSTTTATFSVKPSNAGVGAIASKVSGILNDEPIFLSNTGIYGILTNYSSEKYAINRSGRINRKLCKEDSLENAVGITYNGYYYLSVNSQMYLLDSRHKDSTRSGETSYECYYFKDLPNAKQMFVTGDRMFFTDDNYTYTWNDDLAPSVAYYDNLVLDANGAFVSGTPVHAWWASVFDDDGAPQYLKTLKKKGTVVTLVPHVHSGCYVTLVKNGNDFQHLGETTANIFSFEEIDFNPNSIDFNSNDVAVDRFTKKKIKKYKRLQIRVGNDKAEPFGLTSIVKTYDIGNYAKR